MEIGTSLFGIARKLARWGHGFLEKLICRRAYEISTLYHDHRQLVEARPYPLGEMLGYQLFWDEYLHGARQRAPIIEVRANHGVRLSKVAISVTASNEKVCYQNEVVLRHVDERRHRATLSSIPFRNLKFSGNRSGAGPASESNGMTGSRLNSMSSAFISRSVRMALAAGRRCRDARTSQAAHRNAADRIAALAATQARPAGPLDE